MLDLRQAKAPLGETLRCQRVSKRPLRLEVSDTTEKIWVNPDFKHASEEPEG